MRWSRILLASAGFLGLAGLVLAVLPSRIDPVAWSPPVSPALEGLLAPNEALRGAHLVAPGQWPGPETVALDTVGRLYAGCADGLIRRTVGPQLAPATPNRVEVFADTGGRPLGMDFDASDALIVADAVRGLLRISPAGEVESLATQADGLPFGFTDDVKVGADGRYYFSDASDRFGVGNYELDLFEGRPHGRLLRYDPATRTTEVLARDLYFANGVAVSPELDFVLVNETYRYRISRLWLTGPRAGQLEVFADGLPGFPDGLSLGRDGRFYVALFTIRNGAADFTAGHPWMRSVLTKLPRALWPKPERHGFVLALDEDGRPVQTWQDPGGALLWEVTAARRIGDRLYLGSLHNERGVAFLDL